MFSKALTSQPLTIHDFTLYPDITNREAWANLDDTWKKETLALGETYLNFDFPALLATDFLDFTKTGNRTRYENKLFSKRHALNALVLAECVENNGRFMDDIINGIFSICEESAWQLPAHNTYIRDTPQLPLPDSTAPVLDLFACETGSILAAVSYLLGSELDKISPFITKRIANELEHRIYNPYLNCHFWWMGNGKEPMNNWTIWCTQNVLLSVFLVDSDTSFREKVIEKACKSTDYFLVEYGEDGCCDEGSQYYRHAGLCLFNTLEILNAVTNNHFSDLYKEAKIRNIASYIMNVHIHDIYYLNFADCSPIAGRAGVREFLFGKQTNNPAMMSFAATEFVAGENDTLILPKENNLYYRLQNAFTIKEILSFSADCDTAINYPEIFYPSTGIFITRDEELYLAVKGGDNDDSHNHNDTGSFTVYKNGQPMFVDIGVESYTKKTFSPQRYEIWTMQSAYHNLPTINGIMQKDGAEYEACDVAHFFSDTISYIQMNIANAYPKEAGIAEYYRKAFLIKGEKIVIQDSFSFTDNQTNSSVVLSFMTYEKPYLHCIDEYLTINIGNLGELKIKGGSLKEIEEIPITDARLQTAWKHPVYRILVTANVSDIIIHIS